MPKLCREWTVTSIDHSNALNEIIMTTHRTQEQAEATMQKLVAYASNYSTGFERRIRGASLDEIDALESLAHIPMPADYRAFLQCMGRDDAGLDIGQSASTNIEEVMAYYKDATIFPEENLVPADCIMIAVNGYAVPNLALFISEGREPAVVCAEDNRIDHFLAASLPIELHRVVFVEHHLGSFPLKRAYFGPPGSHRSREYENEASALGFEKQWFSDGVAYCGTRHDAVLGINMFRGNQVVVQVGASSEAELERIGQRFQSLFGLFLSSAKTSRVGRT